MFLFGKPDAQANVLMQRAINGHGASPLETLEMYANRRNWRKVAHDEGMMWVWCGPIECAPEAAERAVEEGDKAFAKEQKRLAGERLMESC